VITALNPTSGVHGQTINLLTVTGERLGGATALTFLKDGTPDSAITATNLSVNSEGTQLTATVTIAAAATLGTRVVTVTTPEGTSDTIATSGNTFTVLGQITLVPDFLSLVEGQSGGLTVQLSAPAPTGGLIVTLESAAPGIATAPANVTVPAGATGGPTSVAAVFEGTTNITASAAGFASGHSVVTVRAPVPTIGSFNPSSGKVGTTVVLSGTGFRLMPSANTVRFTGPNSTWVAATATAASSTSLTVTVPTGAITGPLQVTTSGGTATSTGHFIVLPTQDFTLVVEPLTATAVAGTSVNLKVSTVTTGGYTGLASLSTGPLPAGVTGTFTPPNLGPNASGLLTLTTSGSTPSSSSIEVRGTATIEGAAVTRSGTTLLNVQGAGQTVLAGQVRDENDKPLAGVTIKLGGSTITTLGTTDPAGNFLVSLSIAGPQVFLIDGSTANTPTVTYPTIPVTVNIQAGLVNSLGYSPHLMAHPRGTTIPILSGQETVLAPAQIPGLEVRIPAGTTIIGWDGQPNTEIGVIAVPADRSGAPPVPAGQFSRTIYAYTFGKVGGGTPSQPVPITYPNDLDALPGEQVDLYFYDEAPDGTRPNVWVKYGTGTVSSDGTKIVPDTDPSTGKPYGVPRFCCGYNRPARRVPTSDRLRGPYGDTGGDPVELKTGALVLTKTDLVLPGRVPLVVTRTYRAGVGSVGPFGIGTSWDYDRFLIPPPNGSADFLQLLLAGDYFIPFARQSDGSFQNSQDPTYRGARVTLEPGLRVLRFKDGTIWRFRTQDGLLVSQTDRNANTVTISRDSQGRVTALTEPAGRQVTFSYSGTNLRVDRITDPLGRTVQYTYDGQGRLTSVTDPAGGITQYTYDANHRLLTITDPRNITFLTNEYDAQGRVIRQTQADAGVFTFEYTVSGGFITSTTVTDPRGNRTISRFNNFGYLISQTDALGQTTTFERQPGTNFLLSTTDPLSRVTRFEYDQSGNVTRITDPQGNARTFTYDPTFNKVTSVTDPLGNLTTFEYNAQGNLISTTDPVQNTRPPADRLKTTFTYNTAGQPLTTTDPLGNTTTFEYDGPGNLTTITDPLGNTTHRTYDLVSRLITQADPLGRTTRFGYDALNRLVNTADALNGVTTFGYDPNGNLLTVTDARGNSITHEYDSMDRLSRRIDQLGKAEIFSYDGNGNLVSTTDRKLQTTISIHDALNRRTQAGYADGAMATFSYDAAGRLLQADDTADPHRPINMEYDPLDRLLAETTSLGTVSYQYDSLGRRTQMTVSGQSPVSYTYDAVSRLRTITQAPLNPVDFQYDAAGRRTLLSLPNGVSTEYAYDPGSRLTALIYRNALGQLGDLTYQYDHAGNRIATRGFFSRTLLPDPVPSATYDAANRQLAFGDKTTTFDDNGSLLTIMEVPGVITFTWDSRNRLAALSGAGVAGTFAYDATGRRVRRDVNGELRFYQFDKRDIAREVLAGTEALYLRSLGIDEALMRGTESAFLQDGTATTIAELDGGGAVKTEYAYEPFGNTARSGATSVNAVQFTGRENDGIGLYYYRARYYAPRLHRFIAEDPLTKTALARPTTTNPFRFPGRGNQGIRLNYALPGHTSSILRRFISEDPKGLREWQGNLYAYVRNDPINLVDPTGLWYVDFNVSGGNWLGVTAGVMVNDSGVYPYVGGGVVTPGVGGSITYSQSDPTPGWNVGLQGQAGVAGQVGYGFGDGGGWFYEYGVGWPPGASLTGYYVFGPFPYPGEPDSEGSKSPGGRK
jgi:RHS repeat-associated protein